jgi:hypothetical protein
MRMVAMEWVAAAMVSMLCVVDEIVVGPTTFFSPSFPQLKSENRGLQKWSESSKKKMVG